MGFLAVAAVYGYIKQPMKALYVSGSSLSIYASLLNSTHAGGLRESTQITPYTSKMLLAACGPVRNG